MHFSSCHKEPRSVPDVTTLYFQFFGMRGTSTSRIKVVGKGNYSQRCEGRKHSVQSQVPFLTLCAQEASPSSGFPVSSGQDYLSTAGCLGGLGMCCSSHYFTRENRQHAFFLGKLLRGRRAGIGLLRKEPPVNGVVQTSGSR